MSQTFGTEVPRAHQELQHQPPVRFVALIDSATAGTRLARLFLASREAVAEFDAGSPEVQMMTRGLVAARDALRPEWDHALAGHSAEERRTAEIYTLDL